MQRRQFLKTAAAAGVGCMIMPGVRLFGADAASNKLNIALIGSWGRGEAHFGPISSENVVAICDINEKHMAGGGREVPEGQEVHRLAQVPRTEGHQRRGHLHDRPHPRVRGQLGAEPRLACLLRKAAGQQRRGSPHRPREVPEEQEQAGHAGRHAAAAN